MAPDAHFLGVLHHAIPHFRLSPGHTGMSFHDYDVNLSYLKKFIFGITKGAPPRVYTKETK